MLFSMLFSLPRSFCSESFVALSVICSFSVLHAQPTVHGRGACRTRCFEGELAIQVPWSVRPFFDPYLLPVILFRCREGSSRGMGRTNSGLLKLLSLFVPVQILRLPAKAKILLATFAGFVNNATGDNNHSVHRGASHSMLYRRYLDVCEKVRAAP